MSDQFTVSAQPRPGATAKACGHVRHVGTCATCQRAQLERWNAQLAQAQPHRHSATR